MTKTLLYNLKTGELKITEAKPDGPVINKYYDQGYVAIGNIRGINVSVSKLNKTQELQLKTMLSK